MGEELDLKKGEVITSRVCLPTGNLLCTISRKNVNSLCSGELSPIQYSEYFKHTLNSTKTTKVYQTLQSEEANTLVWAADPNWWLNNKLFFDISLFWKRHIFQFLGRPLCLFWPSHYFKKKKRTKKVTHAKSLGVWNTLLVIVVICDKF